MQRDADEIRSKYLEQRRVELAAQAGEYGKVLAAAQPFDQHQGW